MHFSYKPLHIFASVVILANIVALSVAIFWLAYPYKIVDVVVPMKILNPNHEVAIGEPIVFEIKVKKYSNVAGNIGANITCNDGNLVTLAPSNHLLPVGTYTIVSDKFVLPPKVAVGSICRFNFDNTFQVNPIRTIIKHWYSEEFVIKAKKPLVLK